MKILILGAAGQIPRYLTPMLLEQTDAHLVLFARDGDRRIAVSDPVRETVVNGDFTDRGALKKAMQGVDIVYMNSATGDLEAIEAIITSAKEAGVKHIIFASVLGIYGEVPGEFGEWNRRMVGDGPIQERRITADYIESAGVDYTILRLTWLYDQDGNHNYELTQKGEPFKGAQVSRQAVAQLIVDIVKDKEGKYRNKSLGVGEPGTDFDRPAFY